MMAILACRRFTTKESDNEVTSTRGGEVYISTSRSRDSRFSRSARKSVTEITYTSEVSWTG